MNKKTKKIIMDLYWEHKETYAFLYAEEKNISLDDVSEEDIFPNLHEDFNDKDFTEKEIKEILSNKISEHTLYKLGAYMIALFNQPDTFEEWKISIKEDVEVELPEEECLKLWDAYKEIDY